eukprot:5962310-Pleurochrysis_carterae.AAC.6
MFFGSQILNRTVEGQDAHTIKVMRAVLRAEALEVPGACLIASERGVHALRACRHLDDKTAWEQSGNLFLDASWGLKW